MGNKEVNLMLAIQKAQEENKRLRLERLRLETKIHAELVAKLQEKLKKKD